MIPINDESTRRGGVLVNELDQGFGDRIAAFLRDEGYEPCMVQPHEVVAKLAENPDRFDVILTEVLIPEGDGLQLARACLEMKPELKVIFTSSCSRLELLTQNNLLTPADRFIRKPFGRRALARKVTEVLATAKTLAP